MFLHLSKVPNFSNHKEEYLQKAIQYIKPAIRITQAVGKNRKVSVVLPLMPCNVYN